MQHKLVSLQGAAQEPFEGLPRGSPRSHVRLEELEIVASLFLRVVHRSVRTLEQALCILTVVGVPADANARVDAQLVPCDSVRRRDELRSEEHTSELQSQSNLVCR